MSREHNIDNWLRLALAGISGVKTEEDSLKLPYIAKIKDVIRQFEHQDNCVSWDEPGLCNCSKVRILDE